MPAEFVQVITPVATLVLGAVLARLADDRKDGRVAKREREAAARQDERERKAFERATLIELQDALGDLVRASGAIHHLSEMEYRRVGTFGREQVGEWSERHGDALRNVDRLRVRLPSRELRERVDELTSFTVTMAVGALPGITDDDMRMRAQNAADEAMRVAAQLNEAIGERLRALA
jgi:hypothetical protein